MARRNHVRPPAPAPGTLPVQPDDYPRLFQIAHYAARASESLLEKITAANPRRRADGFTFHFLRGGKKYPVSITERDLMGEREVEIIRRLALEVVVNASK